MATSNAFLTVRNGVRAGSNYVLEADKKTRIGRGLDCQIMLTDPLSSRVHAIIVRDEDGWWLCDADSRNGTYLNGQKIDKARLVESCAMSVGQAQFTFHQGVPNAAFLHPSEADMTQTLVFDAPVRPADMGSFVTATLLDDAQAKDLLDLYQLTISLLGCSDPDEVLRESLEMLQQRTHASVVGFLWVNDDGELRPKLVIPEDSAGKVTLSESLTEKVRDQGRAVRINSHGASNDMDSLRHFADAICTPLVKDEQTLGAIHLYLEAGRFSQSDFEVAVSVANILVVALTRARQWARLQADHERLIDKSAGFDELVGDSPPMFELKSKIRRVARAAGCVLVRGESGSGKELVARAVHRASPRADRPMLSVNCAAIPRDLMESQLFGHKRGAFTGAEMDHVGWFEQSDSGTLFLDEVGEMTLEGQAKLLRILEGHPFLPVGGQKEVQVDVRVIAATNRDLREFVRDKRFREDLYYRLSVFELDVPPLRERGEDIARLVDFFLDHFRHQHGRPDLELSKPARTKLLSYQWPGNVRQLRNVIDSAVVMAEADKIQPEDLGLRDVGGDELESLRIDYWEKKLIQEALTRTSRSIPAAAKLLGIGRATLYRKVDDYDIKR
jgi:Nif-specific regulatory protein